MRTEIIDKRVDALKTFDELHEGEMFFLVGSLILRMKISDVTDDNDCVIANAIDVMSGYADYIPISDKVETVKATITIE